MSLRSFFYFRFTLEQTYRSEALFGIQNKKLDTFFYSGARLSEILNFVLLGGLLPPSTEPASQLPRTTGPGTVGKPWPWKVCREHLPDSVVRWDGNGVSNCWSGLPVSGGRRAIRGTSPEPHSATYDAKVATYVPRGHVPLSAAAKEVGGPVSRQEAVNWFRHVHSVGRVWTGSSSGFFVPLPFFTCFTFPQPILLQVTCARQRNQRKKICEGEKVARKIAKKNIAHFFVRVGEMTVAVKEESTIWVDKHYPFTDLASWANTSQRKVAHFRLVQWHLFCYPLRGKWVAISELKKNNTSLKNKWHVGVAIVG